MFKYISEILSKFTQKQRIVALIIVLLSIIIIMVTPKIIENLTYNNDELELRVESQKKQISELTLRVNELNTTVIKNQKECTDEMIRRESEILTMIEEIENYGKNIKPKTKIVKSERFNNPTVLDTVESVMAMVIPERTTNTTIIQTKPDDKLMGMIKKLKNKVSENCEK